MSQRILLVEDDRSTADFLSKGLREEGFTVEQVADGRDGLYLARSRAFAAVILARSLPGLDGLSVVKALRAAAVQTPILILSAKAQLDDRVQGLRAGCDDYLVKPFGFSELHARLENLMRRRISPTLQGELSCGDLRMHLLPRRVPRGDRTLDLLPRELTVLEHLLRHIGMQEERNRTIFEKIRNADFEVQRPVFYAITIIITA